MYKLEFELKQHTPIIHLQATDIGATLRASEVKPKLDRFILTEVGRKNSESKGLPEKVYYEKGKAYFKKEDEKALEHHKETKERLELYLIPGQDAALNYKLSFNLSPDAQIQTYLPTSRKVKKIKPEIINLHSTPYFANEDKIKDPSKGPIRHAILLKSGIVRGKIFTHKEGLLRDIKYYLESFFLLHNFGARQTKGFGSYTLFSLDQYKIDLSSHRIGQTMQKLGVSRCLKCKESKSSTILEKITAFHNELKTNPNKGPSKIRLYFHKQEIEWEKPIEREMLCLSRQAGTMNYTNKYVRALLGLHGLFDFSQLGKQIKVSHSEIQRFASPILYKPIGNIIFLIPKEIDKRIFNTVFTLSVDDKKRFISTPNEKEFKLIDFINFLKDKDLIYTEDL